MRKYSQDDTAAKLRHSEEEFDVAAEAAFLELPTKDVNMGTFIKATIINNEMENRGFEGTTTSWVANVSEQEFTVEYGPYSAKLRDSGYDNPSFNKRANGYDKNSTG